MAQTSRLKEIEREARSEFERLGRAVTRQAVEGYAEGAFFFDFEAYLAASTAITLNSKILATKYGLGGYGSIASVDDISEYWLFQKAPGVDITLSQSLHKATKDAEAIVGATIKQHVKATTTWKRLAKELTEKTNTLGDTPKVLKDLQKQAEEVFGKQFATTAQKAELRRLISKVNSQVKKLAQNGAPTKALQNAYRRVIQAAEKGDVKLLARKMSAAVQRKAIYNNERISRTEIARAQYEAFTRRAKEEGIKFVRSVLDDRHRIFDECTMIAQADFYGLGPGVYPIEKAPQYPYHPNCLCDHQTVTKRDIKGRKPQFSNQRAEEYLSKLPEYKRNAMLQDGNIKDWRQDLKGYEKELERRPKPLPKKYVVVKN